MIKDGIIAIDKPEHISSAAVVTKIKRKLGVKKVGHTGTLDPFATGLLLCGIDKGTKLSQFFLGGDKSYIAEILLGIETDTQDYTGQIINKSDPLTLNSISNNEIVDVVSRFKGIQMQSPPIYSALKHNGQPLYKLARQGQPIQKPPRKIQIYSIEVLSIKRLNAEEVLEFKSSENISENIKVEISIYCSSGTYIRSLAQDIGKKLGCGACLSSLRRTKTCSFSIEDSISLNEFEKMPQEDAFSRIINMSEALSFMPTINADKSLINKIRFGQIFTPQHLGLLNCDKHLHFLNYNQELNSADSNKNLSDQNLEHYFKIIDYDGECLAVVKYNPCLNRYDYCCVFIN